MRYNPAIISSTYSAIAPLNSNFADIQALFEKCVFRDGSATNSMLAALNMNFFPINNLAPPSNANDPVRLTDLENAIIAAGGDLAGLAASTGASLIGMVQTGTGAVTRTVQSKLRDIVNARDFGAAFDATTDDTAAIQAGIDYLSGIGGGTLILPPGTAKITSYITLHPFVNIRGAGFDATTITCSHGAVGGVGSLNIFLNDCAFVALGTINSQTVMCQRLEDFTIKNTNSANVGAGYYNRSGAYVYPKVRVDGFKYGIVFDQTENAFIRDCVLEVQNAGGASVWLVNGPNINPTASIGFTNQITVENCQINQSSGVAYGILDDGGYARTFKDNNYNGCINHLRLAGSTCLIINGEYEAASSDCIYIDSVTSDGRGAGSNVVSVSGGTFIPQSGKACIKGSVAGPGWLKLEGANLNGTGYAVQGAANFHLQIGINYNNTSQTNVADGIGFQHVDFSNGNIVVSGTVTALTVTAQYASQGDVTAAILSTNPKTQHWTVPLTADRLASIDRNNRNSGDKVRVVRRASATGAFNLTVVDNGTGGTLKVLSAAGQWCDVVFDGTAWQLDAYGTL